MSSMQRSLAGVVSAVSKGPQVLTNRLIEPKLLLNNCHKTFATLEEQLGVDALTDTVDKAGAGYLVVAPAVLSTR